MQTEEHAGTQEGTLHFHYLLNAGGGLVRKARGFDEHVGQLARALEGRPEAASKRRGFLEAFVRPWGLDVSATPLIADGIEELGRLPHRAPKRPAVLLYPLRWLLLPVALGLKVVRHFTRTQVKRQRKLRPLTLGGFVLKPFFDLLDLVLRWRPAKGFVKKYVVPRVMSRMNPDEPTEEMVAIPRIIDKMHKIDRPLVVGPWLSEVGFELLYWIPFLNWVKTYRNFDPERLIILSRGGVTPWYRHIGSRYIDVFDFFTPDQLRQRTEEQIAEGRMKQQSMTDFEREVVKLAKVAIQRRDVQLFQGRIPDFPVTRSHPPASWPSAANSSICRTYRKTAGEESRRRSPVANRWMRP